MDPKRVLIAGCGDVGTRVGLLLAAAGDTVFGLRRDPNALPAPIIPLALDLRADFADTLPAAIDAVVFCAAPDVRAEQAYRDIYLHAPSRLLAGLDASPRRVVFVSSTAVYAQNRGEWVREDSLTAPTQFNGCVLLEAENALRKVSPPSVVLRLSGLYGPGRGRALRRALGGEIGSPRWSNRIHVDDAAAAIVHLLGLPEAEPLYLGSDAEPVREDVLFAWLREQAGLAAVGPPPSLPASGRRIDAGRLSRSGLALRYPDFRSPGLDRDGMRSGAGLV